MSNYNYKEKIVLFFVLIINIFSFGQTGWTIDQTFNKRIAKTDDFFFRVDKRTDNKFLFCTNNDKTKLKLLNADGTISTTFEVPTTGNIFAVTQATGDKTYVGGDFTNMMNVFAPKIARINADGTRDINFLPDANSQNVHALQEQADGKLLVGREASIQRLNTDGTLDTSFTTVATNGVVYSFAILPSGKILVGGLFTTINGSSRNRVVLLNADGTVDTTFVVGAGFNSDVHIVRVANDGSFFVGGKFTAYKGTTINRIAKLSSTGTLDTTFHTSNTGFDNDVWTIEFLNDNKPLIGGLFTTYKGIANNSVIKLNLDGTVDSSFDTGIAQSNGIVYKIIVNSVNDVFLSGTFMKYKDIYTNQAFIANNDGSVNTSFQLDERFCISGIVNYYPQITGLTQQKNFPTVVQSDGKMLLSNVYFDNQFYRLIRLNTDGTKDNSFNFNPTLPASYVIWDINKIIIRPNGKIICSALRGRSIPQDGSLYFKGLFQLNSDGSLDDTFDTGFIFIGSSANELSQFDNDCTIALQPDGKLIYYSKTSFNYKGFQANAGAIRILENGNVDISFQNITGSFFSNCSNCLPKVNILVLPDNKILLYTRDWSENGYGANPINTYTNIANRKYSMVKLNSDGTIAHRYETFNLWNNDNTQGAIISKIIIDGNSLIVTGKFTHVNANLQRSIARIDFDGNLISDFSSPIPAITIKTYNDVFVTDIIKHNNKYYYSTFLNLANWTSPNPYINPTGDNDIIINRLNLDGTIDTTFSTVNIDRSNHIYTTNPYSPNFPFGGISPRNVFFEFNEENRLVVFGNYNSINNEPYIGLSRITINDNLSSSNDQVLGDDIVCYPNPAKDLINISCKNEAIVEINLYDKVGRLLNFQTGRNHHEILLLQDYPKGLYLIEIKTKFKKRTIKIIKQ